jgi:hypothetical protein
MRSPGSNQGYLLPYGKTVNLNPCAMKTTFESGIFLIVLFSLLSPGLLTAQQQQASLQDILGGSKNIFLLVSAEQLYEDAGNGISIDVANYCALQDNAGNIKYRTQSKYKDEAFGVEPGEEITWIGKVDPASRNNYKISILQIVVKVMENQNIFESTYLPSKNKKVVADVLPEVPVGTLVQYDIWFSLESKEGDTKVFILDPWLLIK